MTQSVGTNCRCFSQAELFFTPRGETAVAVTVTLGGWDGQGPVWDTSQLHQCVWFQFSAISLTGKKTLLFFLSVCFIKRIPGVDRFFFLVCLYVEVLSSSRTYALTPKIINNNNYYYSNNISLLWVQHTGLANLGQQPNRNKLFDLSKLKI